MPICRTMDPAPTHARDWAKTLPRNVATQRERGKPDSALREGTKQMVTIGDLAPQLAVGGRSAIGTESEAARASGLARVVALFPFAVSDPYQLDMGILVPQLRVRPNHAPVTGDGKTLTKVCEDEGVDRRDWPGARWVVGAAVFAEWPIAPSTPSYDCTFPLGATSWERPARECGLAGFAFPREVAGREGWRAGPAPGRGRPGGIARGRS
jgi:hypothetical protein